MESEALTFGGRLRRMCEHAGVPLGEMAAICGVGPSGFAAYVNNRVRMPASKYILIAKRLGISMDGLYCALGLDDSERGEQDFAAWWGDMLVRHHSMEAAGFRASINPDTAPGGNSDRAALTVRNSRPDHRSTSGLWGALIPQRIPVPC